MIREKYEFEYVDGTLEHRQAHWAAFVESENYFPLILRVKGSSACPNKTCLNNLNYIIENIDSYTMRATKYLHKLLNDDSEYHLSAIECMDIPYYDTPKGYFENSSSFTFQKTYGGIFYTVKFNASSGRKYGLEIWLRTDGWSYRDET